MTPVRLSVPKYADSSRTRVPGAILYGGESTSSVILITYPASFPG